MNTDKTGINLETVELLKKIIEENNGPITPITKVEEKNNEIKELPKKEAKKKENKKSCKGTVILIIALIIFAVLAIGHHLYPNKYKLNEHFSYVTDDATISLPPNCYLGDDTYLFKKENRQLTSFGMISTAAADEGSYDLYLENLTSAYNDIYNVEEVEIEEGQAIRITIEGDENDIYYYFIFRDGYAIQLSIEGDGEFVEKIVNSIK